MADRDIEQTVDMLFEGYPDPPRPPGDYPPPVDEQEARHQARRKTIENRRARQAAAIANGVHPLNGRKLLGDHTCGDCGHRFLRRMGGTYQNCDLGPSTRGPATDVKASWPACDLWEARDG